jgi:hypothetical protein
LTDIHFVRGNQAWLNLNIYDDDYDDGGNGDNDDDGDDDGDDSDDNDNNDDDDNDDDKYTYIKPLGR